MKKLLFSLVAAVLFVIGCQENSIIDPVSTESINKNQTTGENFTSGVIPLEGTLEIPNQPNSYMSINGQVDYVHELFFVDPIPPAPQYYVNLSLNVYAELIDLSSPLDQILIISTQTNDIFYVSEEGIYLLVKTFVVQGREDGLVLKCRFLVTTDGIGLNEMWLELGNDNTNVNN